MQNKYNKEYSGLEELLNLEVMKNYNNFIVKSSLKYKKNPKRIIDFGAGIGTLSLIFSEKYGLNPLCIEIDTTNKKYLSELGFHRLESLEEISEKADLIFSSNVLEHIEDDVSVLMMMESKLHDDGQIYLYLPSKMSLWTNMDDLVGHYRRYEMVEIVEKCKKAGLEVFEVRYADAAGYFATMLMKMVSFNTGRGIGSLASLKIYDTFLFPISKLMDFLGCKYLFGKNLIVYARKEQR